MTNNVVKLPRINDRPFNAVAVRDAIMAATDAEQVYRMEKQLDGVEQMMVGSGLYPPEQIREVNELRMRSRWRLGGLLSAKDRAHGPGRGKKMSVAQTSFRGDLDDIGLDKSVAHTAQRIGAMPELELEKAFAWQRDAGALNTFKALIVWARAWWFKENREARHQAIHDRAALKHDDDWLVAGSKPLIYLDPPWKFEIYSEKGLERTPDQHYPTLSDDEIIAVEFDGLRVPEIAADDAAMFLWCTSSNVERALHVMRGFDFQFKTSAAWDKERSGTGLVFRNQHEILLYGIRGNMPGPQFQPNSIFRYPRGWHSAKPPEIRTAIEKMYPDFDERTRLELFAREQIEGWCCRGFEAG